MDARQREKLEADLSAYLDNELAPDQRAEVESFLAEDGDARAVLEDLQTTIQVLGSLPRAHASDDLMDALRVRLERRALLDTAGSLNSPVEPEPAEEATSWLMLRATRWVAAAAVVGLSVTTLYFIRPWANNHSAPAPDQLALRDTRTRSLADRTAELAVAPDKTSTAPPVEKTPEPKPLELTLATPGKSAVSANEPATIEPLPATAAPPVSPAPAADDTRTNGPVGGLAALPAAPANGESKSGDEIPPKPAAESNSDDNALSGKLALAHARTAKGTPGETTEETKGKDLAEQGEKKSRVMAEHADGASDNSGPKFEGTASLTTDESRSPAAVGSMMSAAEPPVVEKSAVKDSNVVVAAPRFKVLELTYPDELTARQAVERLKTRPAKSDQSDSERSLGDTGARTTVDGALSGSSPTLHDTPDKGVTALTPTPTAADHTATAPGEVPTLHVENPQQLADLLAGLKRSAAGPVTIRVFDDSGVTEEPIFSEKQHIAEAPGGPKVPAASAELAPAPQPEQPTDENSYVWGDVDTGDREIALGDESFDEAIVDDPLSVGVVRGHDRPRLGAGGGMASGRAGSAKPTPAANRPVSVAHEGTVKTLEATPAPTGSREPEPDRHLEVRDTRSTADQRLEPSVVRVYVWVGDQTAPSAQSASAPASPATTASPPLVATPASGPAATPASQPR